MTTTAGAEQVQISPPNFRRVRVRLRGTAPYVQNKFSQRAREEMMRTQEQGAASKKGKKREPKDFDASFREAIHFSTEGWAGIPASSFRNGLIDACRLVGFKMTHAKLGVFVVADGFDGEDGQPLVRITKGDPVRVDMAVRNQSGVPDIRSRPMWREWEADVTIDFDADMFSPADLGNLLHRVGKQVGIGAGRPFSKESAGLGFGTFDIVEGTA